MAGITVTFIAMTMPRAGGIVRSMADRATVTIFVYDMPPEHEADFFDYLRDIGVEDEYEPDGVNPPEVIGVDHYVPEMVLGGESEVADQLDEWGAVYRVHQAPQNACSWSTTPSSWTGSR